jgi:hypothetical protein
MKRFFSGLAAAFAIVAVGHNADAALVINSVTAGAPTGAVYANFDNLALGNAGGSSGGINVAFTGTGQTVTGSVANVYAAPNISNSNGVPFGDNTVSGPDTTRYLTTGTGSVTLTFTGPQATLGLLWGSVDSYNTLEFFNGNSSVGSLTGSQVLAFAGANPGANGTYYVNIGSTLLFNRVVATSTSNAFEIDNVAFSPVPEPSTTILLGTGLAGLALARLRKRS